ncbi:MAG: hypothetical protein SOR86_00205 [Sodaliphilus sp.]|nr:hypothetical protein [Sodaliphilus sp.]
MRYLIPERTKLSAHHDPHATNAKNNHALALNLIHRLIADEQFHSIKNIHAEILY